MAGELSSAGVAVLSALEVGDVLMGLSDDVSSRPGLPANLDLSSLMLHEGHLRIKAIIPHNTDTRIPDKLESLPSEKAVPHRA